VRDGSNAPSIFDSAINLAANRRERNGSPENTVRRKIPISMLLFAYDRTSLHPDIDLSIERHQSSKCRGETRSSVSSKIGVPRVAHVTAKRFSAASSRDDIILDWKHRCSVLIRRR